MSDCERDPLDTGIVEMVRRNNHARETAINENAARRLKIPVRNSPLARAQAAQDAQREAVHDLVSMCREAVALLDNLDAVSQANGYAASAETARIKMGILEAMERAIGA